MVQGAFTLGITALIGTLLLCQAVDMESAATATSTTAEVLNLSKTTSGTPAAGFGAGLRFEVEDAGGAEEQASIDAALDDTTNGAEDATLYYRVNQAGTMTTAMQVDGTVGYVGIGGDPATQLEVASSTEEVVLLVEATAASSEAECNLEFNGVGNLAMVRFYEDATERVRYSYSASNNRFNFHATNGSFTLRVTMNDGSDDIDGDGTWSNNAFGPSEWVVGQAQGGEVLCATGTCVDGDGKLRVRVEPCRHDHCRRVMGVAVPEDESVVHGCPRFAYKDTIDEGSGWWVPWRKNHVGLELTGFRFVRVVGPVEVGDLLVASGVRGHARARRPGDRGDVVGMAAQALEAGTGEVWTRAHLQRVPVVTSRTTALNRQVQSLSARMDRLEAALQRLEQ